MKLCIVLLTQDHMGLQISFASDFRKLIKTFAAMEEYRLLPFLATGRRLKKKNMALRNFNMGSMGKSLST